MKRILFIALVVLALFALVACSGNYETNGMIDDNTTTDNDRTTTTRYTTSTSVRSGAERIKDGVEDFADGVGDGAERMVDDVTDSTRATGN